jgi:hypothetical protein
MLLGFAHKLQNLLEARRLSKFSDEGCVPVPKFLRCSDVKQCI